MSVTIVAGSTATFTYKPDVPANALPTVEVFDAAGDSFEFVNIPLDVSPGGAMTEFILTLEDTETEQLLGACSMVWTWEYTDENGTNTVRDTEPFVVAQAVVSVPSLTVDTNSYVTVAEAEDYADSRLGVDAWNASEVGDRVRALRMAARRIDAMPLKGRKYDALQTMEFPRVFWAMGGQSSIYSEEDERYSSYSKLAGYYGDGTVPQRVKDAQVEEAIAILEEHAAGTDRYALQTAGVARVRIGNFEEEYTGGGKASATKMRSAEAIALMRPYTGAVTIR